MILQGRSGFDHQWGCQNMGLPSSFSVKPNTLRVGVPEYDFVAQQRWSSDMQSEMSYTQGSIQTFDSKGKPSDAKSDQND